jgi:phytoene/squalene synthetase
LDELEDYAEKAHSSILYLLLESMNIKDENLEYIASHVGVSYGIMILLRGFAYHSSKGAIYIPRDVMTKCNLKPDVVIRGPRNEQEQICLNNAIFEVASQAFGHLDMARKLNAKGIPRDSIYSLLPAVRSSLFLEDLRKVDFNPVHPTILQPSSHLRFQLSILKSSWFKTF